MSNPISWWWDTVATPSGDSVSAAGVFVFGLGLAAAVVVALVVLALAVAFLRYVADLGQALGDGLAKDGGAARKAERLARLDLRPSPALERQVALQRVARALGRAADREDG